MANKRHIDSIVDEIAKKIDDSPTGRGPAADAAAFLQQARAAKNAHARRAAIARAQKAIGKLEPKRHQATIQRLQAEVLALQGRGGDTEIAYMTPGEIVIPRSLQTPELMKELAAVARAHGVDFSRFIVGGAGNSINPDTGQAEFQNNDNFPPGSFPRQDACWDAGYECLDSDGVSPQERNMCNVARQLCDQAAEVHKNAPANTRFVERFPHGRTVVIPGGNQRPYLGPFVPSSRIK